MILHSWTFRWLTFLMTVVLLKALKRKTFRFDCLQRRFQWIQKFCQFAVLTRFAGIFEFQETSEYIYKKTWIWVFNWQQLNDEAFVCGLKFISFHLLPTYFEHIWKD